MEKQSTTAAGQFSTLKDNVQSLMGDLASGISKDLSETWLPKANELVSDLREGFADGSLQEGIAKVSAGIASVGAAIIVLNIAHTINAIRGVTEATKLMTTAQAAYNAVMAASPWGLLLMGISAATAGFVTYKMLAGNATKATMDLMEETKTLREESEKAAVSIQNKTFIDSSQVETSKRLTDELYSLNDQLTDTTLSEKEATEVKRQMYTIADELQRLMPDVAVKFDTVTGSVITQKIEIEKLISSYERLGKVQGIQKQLDKEYERLAESEMKKKTSKESMDAAQWNLDYLESVGLRGSFSRQSLYKTESKELKAYAQAHEDASSSFESTNKNISTLLSIDQDGATTLETKFQRRTIIITGSLGIPDKGQRQFHMTRAVTTHNPKADGILTLNMNDKKRKIKCRPLYFRPQHHTPAGQEFQAAFLCDDPYFTDWKISTQTLFYVENNLFDGMTFPRAFSYIHAGGNVLNQGHADAEPSITIRTGDPGAALDTGLLIVNTTTGAEIKLNYGPANNEEIIIDISARKITSNINGNILRYMDKFTDLGKFVLVQGKNDITFENFNDNQPLTASITHNNRYIEAVY